MCVSVCTLLFVFGCAPLSAAAFIVCVCWCLLECGRVHVCSCVLGCVRLCSLVFGCARLRPCAFVVVCTARPRLVVHVCL